MDLKSREHRGQACPLTSTLQFRFHRLVSAFQRSASLVFAAALQAQTDNEAKS
jgi:hypothetical protein